LKILKNHILITLRSLFLSPHFPFLLSLSLSLFLTFPFYFLFTFIFHLFLYFYIHRLISIFHSSSLTHLKPIANVRRNHHPIFSPFPKPQSFLPSSSNGETNSPCRIHQTLSRPCIILRKHAPHKIPQRSLRHHNSHATVSPR
jgi:hypothetical protein